MEHEPYGGLDRAFWERKPLVGMIHLQPLPGSARGNGMGMDGVLLRALADARTLVEGGVDALLVENFFDAPFARDRVPGHTIAAMTLAIQAVRECVTVPVGVNVLRNDACSAMAIAHVCGCQFIRVNVYVGAAVTDQGLIEGAAREVVLYRSQLKADVAIWADIFVKHASQLGTGSLEDAARDAVERGLADALIVTGRATGAGADPEEIRRVKEAVPSARVLVGSGLTAGTAREMLSLSDGAIVGASLKRNGEISEPVDLDRVRALRTAMMA